MLRGLTTGLPALLLTCNLALADELHPAAAVVDAFNNAVSAQDMDTAMAQLADGSVQFQVHPAHRGAPGADQTLTMDMAATWQMVSAILFPTAESYSRQVTIDKVDADGELAVVWTTTRTQTVMKGKSAEDTPYKQYSEMWFLINKDGTGWKIAGTASNRPTDDIDIG
ncbi:MAG: hypothetical protein QNJ73_03305 [Gammaproteobacteria bacterium]|nr:hypothetical protein [Gammaproteobacteria bacterium]